MNVSELDSKQDTMDEEMEDLMEVQVWEGLGFCLKFMQLFRMRDRAPITLESLWAWVKRSVMRLARGLAGWVVILLMFVSGSGDVRWDTHFLMGNESSGWMRKLLCNQKSQLI